MGKLFLFVVPVGLAAGILLPYAVLHSDQIASVFKGPASKAPEIEINSSAVRAQPLVAARPWKPAPSPQMKPAGGWYTKDGKVRYRKKRSVRHRRKLDSRSQIRIQKADRDAWQQADRMLKAERSGMM